MSYSDNILSCTNNKEQNDKFLLNMSHEIRTPLNGIVGFIQLLSHTQLCNVQKKYLKSLNECSIQLTRLINDILDISRLNCGKMKINDNCFSIEKQLSSIQDMFSQKIKDKNQTIDIEMLDIPTYIITDEQKLSQIIINLISNAIKFTHINGKIKILARCDTSEHMLYITVSDNGIGITKEHINEIFKHFTQINPSDSSNGCGLGLAICKQLSLLLNGDLLVKSEPKKGSTFTLNIKYKPYDNLKIDFKDSKLKNINVLLVDEDYSSRILLHDMLRDMLMNTTTCSIDKEAYHIINNTNRYNINIVIIKTLPENNKQNLIDFISKNNPLITIVNIEKKNLMFDYNRKCDFNVIEPVNISILYDTLHKSIQDFSLDDNTSKQTSPSHEFKKTCNILITDDNKNNIDVLNNMLLCFGYKNITCSSTGQNTIDLLKQHHNMDKSFDILILDLKMPVISGYDIINYIKENKWKLPKVIVVSASILEHEKNKCKQLGIDYFIPKPVNMTDLKKAILNVSKI